MRACWFPIVAFVLSGVGCREGAGAAVDPPAPSVFARTAAVMQLFESRCLQCHDSRKSRGGFDLSTRAKLLHGGESGPAVVPGSAPKSLLMRLVRHQQEPAMPRQGQKLTDEQIALVAAWIDAGVPYDRSLGKGNDNVAWWSLQPVKKPIPPSVDAKYPEWSRNPIDAFVLAKLQAAKLTPTPGAEPRTLLRRVYFDLIGLPPTPEEMDAFVAAWDSAGAKRQAVYEHVVERLLSSPHYGERWARHWMDVVHFAETHGHDQDVPREHAWPYRDYLIQSFNADKPYARFIQEQIAADVLFPDDAPATTALGFLAAGPWDESSLKDIREDSLDRKAGQYIDRDDMVGTVSLAFLSTTVQCARCHDHKFDPISQKEYYGMQAVFAGVDRANRAYDPDPGVRAQRLALQKRKQELQGGAPVAARLLKDAGVAARVSAWEQGLAKNAGWKVLDPVAFASAEGATLKKLEDGSVLSGGTKPERDTYTIEAVSSDTITALRLETLTDDSLPHRGPGRQDNGNLHLTEIKIAAAPAGAPMKRQPVAVARALADFNQDGWDIAKALDGQRGTAWGIYPAVGKPHAAVFVFKEPVSFPGGTRLTVTLEQLHGGGHLIGRARLSATSAAVTSADITLQPLPPHVQAILTKTARERTEAERATLAHYALTQIVDAELAALPKPRLVYAAATDFQADGSFRPAKGCRAVHVLKRGDVRFPLAPAAPGALGAVSGMDGALRIADPSKEGQRRAALARWVSDPKNALTWRSIVNRVWHYHFGRGLVATPNDFGRLGATPSHPELLDWLTATFQEDGGSLKNLHRRIVTSAAYMQDSRHRDAAARIDADNVLLWRMNVQRLDAESVRDAVLQIAGKLDLTMGGPSVKHFQQSPGIHRTPKVDYQAFDPDAPGGQRRSVYRFIFRTVPDPFMDALDCPDASQFTATRTVSVTALQALALLNDPFMVRMSEHFAKRLAGAGDVKQQVRQAYRLALNREPAEREATLLEKYATRHGMANACRVLLNSNEFAFIP
ncbi:MAG: DUF1553 domain-containing protein [Gemmataceae bacterium]|nr:DUF1553 domain-containing protein [Gemmataceae bacterium]